MKKLLHSQIYLGLKKGEVILLKPEYLTHAKDKRFVLCKVKNKTHGYFYFYQPHFIKGNKPLKMNIVFDRFIPHWTPYELNKKEIEYYDKLLMLEELKGK